MVFALASIAFAERPTFVTLEHAVSTARPVVVATPVRVEFQNYSTGEIYLRNRTDNFCVSYRIDRVVKGDLLLGQSVRDTSQVTRCEPAELAIRREGDRFVERLIYNGQERDLATTLGTDPDTVAKVEALVVNEP